ncbi:Holliday junction resolvase [archaeon]|nr:Holliday junction resolvase [archaeon]
MSKRKGTRYERELFHMFYKKGFMPVRAAGSGSTPIPNPDLIVGGNKKYLAIECKALKGNSKYFKENEIELLEEFSNRFGAEAIVAVRFDNRGWFFLKINKLGKSKKGTYFVSYDLAVKNGLKFEDIIK